MGHEVGGVVTVEFAVGCRSRWKVDITPAGTPRCRPEATAQSFCGHGARRAAPLYRGAKRRGNYLVVTSLRRKNSSSAVGGGSSYLLLIS